MEEYERIALQILDHSNGCINFKEGVVVRLAALIYHIQRYFRDETPDDRADLLDELRELSGVCKGLSKECDRLRFFIDDTIEALSAPQDAPLSLRDKWSNEILSERVARAPSTLASDTKKYYKWLGHCLGGSGEIVELGVWLGGSTNCLAEGVSNNFSFKGRHIHAYDMFRWQSWMNRYLDEDSVDSIPELKTLKGGDDFLDLYLKICAPIRHYIKPHKCAVLPDDGEYGLPPAAWPGDPIELLIYDLAHEFPYAEETWRVFSPSFIRGKTMLVFNVYGNTRAEGLRRFIHGKNSVLRPLHKPRSAAKTFLYIG